MIEAVLLGTGGHMPTQHRRLTSLLVKFNGTQVLVDCGEGTQVSLGITGNSAKNINAILITHLHADHIGGITGMLLLMAEEGKKEPLLIVGPRGVKNIVESLRCIVPRLPYKVIYKEIDEDITREIDLSSNSKNTYNNLYVHGFKVRHSVTCYGYTFKVSRLPKFLPDKAKELGIEQRYWNDLQRGEKIVQGDKIYLPEQVLGDTRKGLKIVYSTDTIPCINLYNEAKGADLVVCEGMYIDEGKVNKARQKKHMMIQEACQLAEESKCKELWITHLSPSTILREADIKKISKLSSRAIITEDYRNKIINFEE